MCVLRRESAGKDHAAEQRGELPGATELTHAAARGTRGRYVGSMALGPRPRQPRADGRWIAIGGTNGGEGDQALFKIPVEGGGAPVRIVPGQAFNSPI
jgi:hypothetical protein